MGLNRAVYLNTLRWFLASTGRLVCAGLFLLFTYAVLSGAAHVEVNGRAYGGFLNPLTVAKGGDLALLLLAWCLGAGIVRREQACGSLALLFTRPLTRAGYVLSKWAALATLLLAFLVFCHGVLLLKAGNAFRGVDEAGLFLAQGVQILALAGVLICLSCLPLGLGELGVALILAVLLKALGFEGEAHGWPLAAGLSDFGFRVLLPGVTLRGSGGPPFAGAAPSLDVAGSVLFNLGVLAASLGLACLVMGRREFGYAQTEAGA